MSSTPFNCLLWPQPSAAAAIVLQHAAFVVDDPSSLLVATAALNQFVPGGVATLVPKSPTPRGAFSPAELSLEETVEILGPCFALAESGKTPGGCRGDMPYAASVLLRPAALLWCSPCKHALLEHHRHAPYWAPASPLATSLEPLFPAASRCYQLNRCPEDAGRARRPGPPAPQHRALA